MAERSGQSDVEYLALDDGALLAQCRARTHRASGPGGQHRNKVSTAVTLHHGPTGITVQAFDARSQQENRRTALSRLRMKIACQFRRRLDPDDVSVPEVVASCLFVPQKAHTHSPRRLAVGRKDRRFWPVVQFLLDLLDACGGRLSAAAERLQVTTSNLASVLKEDRHSYAAAGDIRKRHRLGPLK